jgi:hypothetical protein
MVVVLHIGSDRNESGGAARVERGHPHRVNACCASERSVGAHLSDQVPADIGENKQANDDQSAGDNAAQRGSRHGMGELGAEPGAAAQAHREDEAQGQIELAVNYIPGSRGNATGSWKI